MWHSLKFVAESRRANAEALTTFALAHQAKYGIAADRPKPEVNTWHVDQLMADFKALPGMVAGRNNDDLLRYAVARGR